MADDVMTFPDTWEEFEKYYGFYDSKQAYMYGNTRLIPSFRVQQWLDHIDDTKQSQNNKMEQVASMFGKKLGEEFRAQNTQGVNRAVMFCEEGVMVRPGLNYTWFNSNWWLNDLLTGEANIIGGLK